MSEQRFETRRTFVEGKGHVVEQVPIGSPLAKGQQPVKTTAPPPQPVTVVSVDTVPLLVALQVVERNGMVAVPRTFLTEEQLQDLDKGKDAAGTRSEPAAAENGKGDPKIVDVSLLKADEAIARVQQAATLEELNALMVNDKRPTVDKAAEARAEELKAGGKA